MPFRNHKENNHTDTNQDTSKRNTQTSKQQSSVSTLDDATISISVKFSSNLTSNMFNTLCLQQILISWSLSNWGTCLLWHTKAIRVNSENEYILEACLFIGWQWHAAICTISLALLVAGYWSSWMTSSISFTWESVGNVEELHNKTKKSTPFNYDGNFRAYMQEGHFLETYMKCCQSELLGDHHKNIQ
jgi:hypothetical protein